MWFWFRLIYGIEDMKIIERMINEYKTRCDNRKPKWIIIHYTACLASASSVCDSMAKRKPKEKQSSTNYIVDDKSVIHCVDETCFYAWHCATKGKTMYCGAQNINSIGVDLCEKKKNTLSMEATDNDWYFTDETIANAAKLIADLMTKYHIDIDHVVRHYDVTHKRCPAPFVGDEINQHFCVSGNNAWKAFKYHILNSLDEQKNDLKGLAAWENE